MSEPVLMEGHAALDAIVHRLAPKLSETWPGDEALVGLVVQDGQRIGIVWIPRERALADVTRRGNGETNPRRRQRYERAIAALTAPRVSGTVSLVVAGWGDMVVIEIEAEDLRTGKLLTTWSGGTA